MSAIVKKVPEDRKSGARAKITDLASWAATGKRKDEGKKRSVSRASFDRALAEVDTMMKGPNGGDFTGAKPLHIFALYYRLHEHVYGVPTAETSPAERTRACFLIAQFLRTHFDGDTKALIEFVRWTWRREAQTEAWRRENRPGADGRRVGVYLQFSGRFLTDFRVAAARAHSR